jgi:hypothetical protein
MARVTVKLTAPSAAHLSQKRAFLGVDDRKCDLYLTTTGTDHHPTHASYISAICGAGYIHTHMSVTSLEGKKLKFIPRVESRIMHKLVRLVYESEVRLPSDDAEALQRAICRMKMNHVVKIDGAVRPAKIDESAKSKIDESAKSIKSYEEMQAIWWGSNTSATSKAADVQLETSEVAMRDITDIDESSASADGSSSEHPRKSKVGRPPVCGPKKKEAGRPKGCKTRATNVKTSTPTMRKRGRPKGSKTRTKTSTTSKRENIMKVDLSKLRETLRIREAHQTQAKAQKRLFGERNNSVGILDLSKRRFTEEDDVNSVPVWRTFVGKAVATRHDGGLKLNIFLTPLSTSSAGRQGRHSPIYLQFFYLFSIFFLNRF